MGTLLHGISAIHGTGIRSLLSNHFIADALDEIWFYMAIDSSRQLVIHITNSSRKKERKKFKFFILVMPHCALFFFLPILLLSCLSFRVITLLRHALLVINVFCITQHSRHAWSHTRSFEICLRIGRTAFSLKSDLHI
jgi:hypothetical protein